MDIKSIANLIKYESLIKDLKTLELYNTYCKDLDISSKHIFKKFKDSINRRSNNMLNDIKYLYVGKKDNNYYFLQMFSTYSFINNVQPNIYTSLYILENPKILKNCCTGPYTFITAGQKFKYEKITLFL